MIRSLLADSLSAKLLFTSTRYCSLFLSISLFLCFDYVTYLMGGHRFWVMGHCSRYATVTVEILLLLLTAYRFGGIAPEPK